MGEQHRCARARASGAGWQRAVIPLQLPTKREDVTIGGFPREELQARFHRFPLGRIGTGAHGGIHQSVVDVDVGSHGLEVWCK